MASLDNLPADQRAVLQLVLQRSRSYDQIAALLSMDRSAVRARALAAFDALGPQTGVSDERRGAIADYLLGQLEPAAVDPTRDSIAASPSERAWARVVASELAPLASQPLPEIPSAPAAAAPAADQSPEPVAAVPAADQADADAEPESRRARRRGRRERKTKEPGPLVPEPGPPVPATDGGRRSSRLGGTVLIALTVVIVTAIVIILLSSGGSKRPTPAASAGSHSTPAATSSTAASGTTPASGTGTTAAKVVSQINLTPPTAGSKAAGIAEVLKEGTTNGIAIVGQNVPPNTTRPPNAYAVWLYNSPTDAHILGFVNPGVGANGRLSTAGGLPANAAHFKQLIVTVETKASPKTPGTIILQGTLTGL